MNKEIFKLLQSLDKLGCRLYLEADKLKLDASKGSLTNELKQQIATYKDELVTFLSEKAQMSEEIPAIAKSESYPVSYGQRRLWILSQFEDALTTYNIPLSFDLYGSYDVNVFTKAINAVVDRHEILRTTFRANENGVPEQIVHSRADLGIELQYEDYRGVEDGNKKANKHIREDWEQPFDLENGPLVRLSLSQITDEHFIFYYNMHHIISDGWSMQVLSNDILAAYRAISDADVLEKEPLRIHYKDFTAWQLRNLETSVYQYHKLYWQEKLGAEIPVLNFHSSKKRPNQKTYNGFNLGLGISKEITSNIKQFTKANGGSTFMVLLTAWNWLCSRYTGEKDIVTGVPVVNRDHPDLDDQIGFYLNNLVLRNEVDAQATFVENFKTVKENTLEAYKHQDYPFDVLVQEMNIMRDQSRTPIFDVLIDYHGVAKESLLKVPAGEIDVIGKTSAKFDIELHFYEVNDTIELRFIFNTDIYEEALIKQLMTHYLVVLQNINSTEKLGTANFLSESETTAIETFSKGALRELEHENIITAFQANLKQNKNAVAVVSDGEMLTYQQLEARSNQIAVGLRENYGVVSGDTVGLHFDTNSWTIAAILGILKAGATYVYVDTELPEERKNFIFSDADLKVLITDTNYIFELSEYDGTLFSIDVEFEDSWSTEAINHINESSSAYIIYTSGSTGTPKGVQIGHTSLMNYVQWATNYYSSEGEIPLNFGLYTTLSFDLTVTSVFLPLLSGNTLTLLKDGEVSSVLKNYVESDIECIKLTPAHISVLGALDIQNSNIKVAVVGGDALGAHHVEILRNINPNMNIYNEYGPTEATVGCMMYLAKTEENGAVSIGKPIDNTEIYIVNEAFAWQPIHTSGEIVIAGKGLAEGYVNQAELNAEKFITHEGKRFYRTGDKGKWLANGELAYEGRFDDQIKIKGFRIEIGEITSHLLQKESIQDVAIVVEENDANEKELIAYIVSEQEETVVQLHEYLKQSLPEYMIPTYFIQLPEIPLTSNGKVDKKALPSSKEVGLSTGVEYVAPSNATEEAIIDIWKEILQKEQIGVNDNYFALGGDSIKAINIIIKVNKKLNTNITVSDLYINTTVKTLSDFILAGNADEEINDFTKGYEYIKEVQERVEAENPELISDAYDVIYPLVPVEEGMIYSSLLHVEEPMYYDRFVYIVDIEDIEMLKEAMQKMVQRHTILRTKYYMESFSEPIKVVYKDIDIPMVFEDYSNKSKEEFIAYMNQIREADMKKRLTFDDEFLYDFRFIKLQDSKYCIIWNFHHALLDGWSTSVFTQELTVLLSKKDNKELPNLPYSYVDYAASVFSKKSSEATEAYWKNLLEDYTRTKLPFNFKGVKISDDHGMRIVERSVGEETLKALEALTTELQVSFKAVILAAHAYLLRTICSQEDIVTGVVSHERPELENSDLIMGCFLNTVPTRVNFKDIHTVEDLILHVNDYLIHSKKHEVHISEIASIIGEKTTMSNPIFDTLLNYTHFHIYEKVDFDSTITSAASDLEYAVLAPEEMTNTLMDVELSRRADGLVLRVKYMPTHFTHDDAVDTLEVFKNILVNLPNKGELTPKNVMTEEAYNELVYDYNDTIVEEDQEVTMHSLFEEQVANTPSNIALRQNGETMTYEALNERANVIAHELLTKGITPATNVGLLCTRSFDMVAGLMGILKAGGSYVPIDPSYPIDRQQYIVENSKVQLVLTNLEEVSSDAFDCEFVRLEGLDYTQKLANPVVDIAGNQLAYTIYTSGSTGRPKGVMIEHYSAVNLIRWVNERFNVNQDDRLLFITSECFDLSVYDMFGMLATGGSIVIATKDEVQDFNKLKTLMRDEKITFWDSVPTTFNYLVDELREEGENSILPDLRLVFMSGDWIPVQLPTKAKAFFPNAEIISLGGATEGTVWSNYYPIEEVGEDWSSIPYGKPMRNNFFYILDDQLRPVPKGTVGELFIGGIGVARGYDNDEKKTNAAFMKDPFNDKMGGRMYKTGDLGRWMRNGNMEFIGRKDNQVKIRGFRVELGEIESILSKHEQLKEAIVHVVKDQKGQNLLCAYIVPTADYDLQTIKSYLKEKLPEYMVPSFFMELEALPLNSNGKIDRKALPEPTMAPEEAKEMVLPSTAIEKSIEEVWKGILHVPQISIHENLFELGAYSLSVASFVARFHKKMNYNISVGQVFHHPTIKELATLVSSLQINEYVDITPAEVQESYPLSAAQKGLWLLSQFQDASLAYNVGMSINLREPNFDANKFENAITALIERHEILRTLFRENEQGEIRQWIIPTEELGFKFGFEDIRSVENQQKAIHDYISTDFVIHYNFEEGPLLRMHMFRTSEDEYVFYFNVHHLIIDGWSLHLAFEEIMDFYYRDGVNIPPLKIQYKDYAVWQTKLIQEGALENHKQYWLQQLEGPLPTLELPVRKERPKLKTFVGETLTTYLSVDISNKVRDYVNKNNGSAFMGYLASLNAMFYHYTGQKDIVIGSIVSGREHTDIENQIGLYGNTIVLRNQVDETQTFNQLFDQVKQTTLDAFSHETYPFDLLVEDLDLKADPSRSLAFDVMFVVQKRRDMLEIEEKDTTIYGDEIVAVGNKTSKYDLYIALNEMSEQVNVRIEYNTNVYEREFIEKFINDYKALLTEVFNNPEEIIEDIDYIADTEKERILNEFNDTETVVADKTVIELFQETATQNKEATALTFEGTNISYATLEAKSNQFAQYLQQKHSITSGDYVAIHLERNEQLLIAILGTLKTGATFIPIEINYPEAQRDFILNDSKAKICVDAMVISDFISQVNTLTSDVVATVIQPTDTAYVIYTSGTTGNPKGVMISHEALSNYVQYAGKTYMKEDMSKFLLFTSISFDLTITTLFTPLCHGGSIHIMPTKEHDLQVIDMVETNDFDIIKLTPAHATALIDTLQSKEGNYTGKPKGFIIGGEALKNEVVNSIFNYFGDSAIVWNEYGPTEATVGCIVKEVAKDSNERFVAIGKPTDNVQAYILDAAQRIVPVGVEGEIYLGGKQLAKGYLNQPALTAEKFVPNPFNLAETLYKTGDKARWLPDGNMVYLRREDSQVKIRGYRIELEEIEKVMLSFKTIKQAILTITEFEGEEHIAAYVIANEGFDKKQLRDSMKIVLPSYKIPSFIIELDSIPLTMNGKIAYGKLPSVQEKDVLKATYVAPETELEKELAAIWEDVLGVEKVGLIDDFIELGGHSLKLLRLKNQYHKQFNLSLSLAEMYGKNTIQETAEYIEFIQNQDAIESLDLNEIEL
ncbi:amino acid adenylation domain-containing protein [Kordia periserrulae]|uniref:Amino acid adenylation domain-containing protein n=1 Tax=Kordia periserrulae TaxID=701523 RepID=A0A2T6BZ80_9FLAO|nr:non-ribosomal peptide synthetase [Kordia periserrulae]PTX61368.1 amino acid adenylation domain-containing protein [Kordia periserrulae]